MKQNGETKWVICSAGMGDAPTEYLYGEHADRLAAYEDTGLEPCDYSAMAHALEQAERAREDLTEMIRQIGATGLDRLRELAPALMARMKPGACLVLSGLLDVQADAVEAAYAELGKARRVQSGDWVALV